MELIFLGTSAGSPTVDRNVQSLVLKLENGKALMIDAGEGTQQQLMKYNNANSKAKIKISSIETVFLTHLHGDHLFGVPGLLCLLDASNSTLRIVGPYGLCEFILLVLRISKTELKNHLTIVELLTSTEEKDAKLEIPHFVTYETRHQDVDGVWHDLYDKKHVVQVTAAQIDHANMPCLAYAVIEPPRSGKIDATAVRKRASEANDDPKRIFTLLRQQVSSFFLADGARIDDISQFYVDGITQIRGRKVAIYGDNRPSSFNLRATKMCHGADILVHEATLENALQDTAFERGHSTPGDAGALANTLQAGSLILWHFSPRYGSGDDEDWKETFVQQARMCNTDVVTYHGNIYLAYDFFSSPIHKHTPRICT